MGGRRPVRHGGLGLRHPPPARPPQARPVRRDPRPPRAGGPVPQPRARGERNAARGRDRRRGDDRPPVCSAPGGRRDRVARGRAPGVPRASRSRREHPGAGRRAVRVAARTGLRRRRLLLEVLRAGALRRRAPRRLSPPVPLKLVVEYEGTRYQGWQVQPGGPTVQEVLERARATALREPARARCAGRTDAGVHACGQVAAVKVTRVPADLGRLRKSLNALTPDDVAVREITVVDDAFDPRRHARSRVYEYRILNAPAPSPFWRRHAWHIPDPLDAGAMDAAARQLEGEHDFAAFRAADAEPVRSTVRRVL